MLTAEKAPTHSEVTIGDRIAQVLKERDQHSAWLADRMGVARSTITRVVRGERTPTAETLRDIAVALGMSPEELLAGTKTTYIAPESEVVVPREHFDAAIEQVLRLERETMDLRARAREAEEALAAERARRTAEAAQHAAAEDRIAAAEEKARFHQSEARRYHDALELAVLDVSRLRAEVEALSKATEDGGSASRVAALLAGIAAVASVAAYVGRAGGAKSTAERSSSSANRKGKRK